MDFELRSAREKLEREQRERMQRAKAKADRERRAKAEAARRRDALEASNRERRLDAARAQEEADQKMEEVMQLGKGISFSHMFEALRYDGPGDKIKLPPSSFKDLSDQGALDKGPMYFRLSKVRDRVPGTSPDQDAEEATCCGVLEFTAREGSAQLPSHVWNNLFQSDIPDVPLIEVRYASLPKGTYAKLKPEGVGFSDLPNHKLSLKRHCAITQHYLKMMLSWSTTDNCSIS
uniref:Ubiquitin fusion degradation protein UFD1 N-terminal subdomain 1 domain-containing protein n=1 Tax=Triticum urartu TaxID=4572 RepID=A0A8R7TV35_TRIUA